MPTGPFGKREGPGVSGLGGENRLPGPLRVGAPSEAECGEGMGREEAEAGARLSSREKDQAAEGTD